LPRKTVIKLWARKSRIEINLIIKPQTLPLFSKNRGNTDILIKKVQSMDAGAIILAGGKSRRMGTNKALLPINEITNIERMVKRLQPHFSAPILVTNHPDDYRFIGLKTTVDQFPGQGPLAGIHAGLIASPYEVNLIAACDMPFITAELACILVNHIRDYDAVIPVIYEKQHPLFSVFKKNVIGKIEDCIKQDRLRMKHLFEDINVLYVTEQDLLTGGDGDELLERIFFNMNHPSEYEEAKKWAEAERQDEGGQQ
jgi:molybdopterin-guanine dinucleotide biosynthesis protein A